MMRPPRPCTLRRGNNYTAPATTTSDAFLALDGATSAVNWKHQLVPNDTGTIEADFGDSSQIYTLSGGRKVVGAGQVSTGCSMRILAGGAPRAGGALLSRLFAVIITLKAPSIEYCLLLPFRSASRVSPATSALSRLVPFVDRPKASSYSEERNSFQGVATKVSVDACP